MIKSNINEITNSVKIIPPYYRKVITLEEVLELLDSQANSLYQAFLAEIDSGTSEDPSEVDYIINLVLLRM